MLTKEQVLQLIETEYHPGVLRRLSVRSSRSKNMQSLYDLVQAVPNGVLSKKNLEAIIVVLNLETNPNTETYRTFFQIEKQVSDSLEKQKKYEFVSNVFYTLLSKWKESHYFDRSDSFINAVDEMLPRFSPKKLTYSEHLLAISYLVFSCYGMKYTDYHYFFAGKLSQTVSSSILDNRFGKLTPMLHLLLGLGIQMGFSFFAKDTTDGVGLFVASYVAGTLLETMSSYLFDTVKKKNR